MEIGINIFHIILGIIILILIKTYDSSVREKFLETNKYIFLVVGIIIFSYHVYKFVQSEYKKWIYIMHFLLIAPTIMLLGFYPSTTIQILTLIATSMISFHTYLIIEKMTSS